MADRLNGYEPFADQKLSDAQEPDESVKDTVETYQERLALVRDQLRVLGWEERSEDEAVVLQKQREDKLKKEIEEIERITGSKLSKDGVAQMRRRLEEDSKKDRELYTAKYEELLRQESELINNIENEKPDTQRAEEYWKRALEGESRIETPMDPKCEISIVVPAFNEEPERVMRQIDSLKKQKGMLPGLFEVIYVVNNSPDRPKEVAEVNARLIDFLRQDHGIRIYVIDKSSPGNEIPNCNVGKARNRGVAESSLRFQENGRNGIIIQTDADTWFEDEDYLSKVKAKLDSQPETVGVAGGIYLEWDPETKDPQERAELRRKIDRLFLRKMAERFSEFLSSPNKFGNFGTSFLGANMISRSFESAVVGGVPEIKGGEDGMFGSKLETYGLKKKKSVVGAKHELFAATSFRESDRTGSSLKKIFDSINPDVPEMVSNIFATTDSGEPTEVELNDAYIKRLKAAIRKKEGGNEYIDDFEKSMAYIRLKSE
ncbi:MAG: glycosyltransferase [Candidatus Uhrbacteria bacterium]